MAKKKKKYDLKGRSWTFFAAVIIGLWLLSSAFAGIISAMSNDGLGARFGNVALIPVKGVIVIEGGAGFISGEGASSTDIVEQIERADENAAVKAIVFEIDSPGGMVVPTDEIAQAIKRVNKTTVAWIRSAGASGGYWIATATDRVYANKMSATGSIGVIASYLQFSGMLEKYNVTYERLVSGRHKDMGSPFKNLTADERNIIQQKIDKIRIFFIEEVSKNRNISYEEVEKLATGEVFMGYEALELGLIDEIGGQEEVKEFLKKELNATEIDFVEYKKRVTFFERFGGIFSDNSYNIGKGIGDSMVKNSRESNYPVVWS